MFIRLTNTEMVVLVEVGTELLNMTIRVSTLLLVLRTREAAEAADIITIYLLTKIMIMRKLPLAVLELLLFAGEVISCYSI